jgi:hypothetical protein
MTFVTFQTFLQEATWINQHVEPEEEGEGVVEARVEVQLEEVGGAGGRGGREEKEEREEREKGEGESVVTDDGEDWTEWHSDVVRDTSVPVVLETLRRWQDIQIRYNKRKKFIEEPVCFEIVGNLCCLLLFSNV